MAGKGKGVSPKDCDRWDTLTATQKTISKPTEDQKKFAAQINAERAAAAKKKKKK